MALSKATAALIVRSVVADKACQKAISPSPTFEHFGDLVNPLTSTALEYGGMAGGLRNFVMILAGKGPGDPMFDDRICLGITALTVKAIIKSMSNDNMPEVRACSGAHRVHRGIEHEATWIRMKDDAEYVFDWHASLKADNPHISRLDDWLAATISVPFKLFSGFNF